MELMSIWHSRSLTVSVCIYPPRPTQGRESLCPGRLWRKTEKHRAGNEIATHSVSSYTQRHTEKGIAEQFKILYNAIWVQVNLLRGRSLACAGYERALILS